MHSSKLLLGVLCASTILSGAANAEEKTRLDEVVITAPAPSLPTINSYDPNAHTPSYSFSDGADYLQSIPGITAGRFGGHGLEPFIRGQSQNQLNIIADDSFTFGGCPNRMDPPSAYLDIDTYDTITVTKGYQSVLNGPGAAGGAVILERQAPKLESDYSISGDLTSGYDSNSGAWNAGARALGGNDQAYVRAHASMKDASNYEDGDGDEVRSAFEERTAGLTLGFTPGDDRHIYFSYDLYRIEDALFPGAGMDSPLSDNQSFRAGYEQNFDSGLVRAIDLSAYASLVDHEMDNYSLRPAGMMLRRVDSESNTYGGKAKADLALGEQIVKTTIEYRRNNRDADRFQGMSANNVNSLQSVMWPDITADEIGLAAETTYDLSESSRLTAGGRYDYVNVDYGRADQVAAATGLSANDVYSQFYGYGASEQTEHNLGGLLRYEHDVSDGVTVFSGISRAVRTADATERGLANYKVMKGNNRSWVGNPNIDPEKHHQFDIGFTKDAKQWNFGASAYVNHVSDFILRDSARGQAGILLNAPNADVYRNVDALLTGFELNGAWDITPTLRLTGDATYTYGDNLDDDIALAQIPPLQGTLGMAWQAHEHVALGTNMRWAMQQTRVDTDPTTGTGRDVGETDGYAVFDVNATVTKLEPLSLTVGVSNLFDQTYANHLNRSNISDPTEIQVNEPGRSFYVQARLPF